MTASAPHDRLDDVAAGADAAVGDDVDVAATGLVEVVATGRGDVGDRARHRGVDSQRAARGVRGTATEPDEHAGSPGAHEVQGGGVGGRPADDHGDVELVDEALEVERLGLAGDVLGADGGATDDEQVDPGVDDVLPELLGALRAQRAGHRDAGLADLAEPFGDEPGLDLGGVDLLHPGGGDVGVEPDDLGEQPAGVLVTGPQPLEVEDGQAT